MITGSHSLQRRLVVGVIGLVAVAWFGVAIVTWFDARHELDELLDSHLAQAAALLVAQQMREAGDDDDTVHAPALHRYAPKVAFQVWHDGRLSLRSANAPADWPRNGRPELSNGFHTMSIGGTRWRVFATRGAERDVRVLVAEQLDSRSEILRAVLRGMLAPMVVGLPLLALLGAWGVRRGLRPLHDMGQALAARDPRALQAMRLPDAPAEMAPMVQALNALFERIAALMETERRFTADAAHELRTPIAAIRTQAQVALGEADGALREHALRATIEGCDRATHLVEQLMTLSRLEAAESPALGDVDLAAVARRVAAEIAPRAIDRGQQIDLEATAPVIVRGNDALLGVLVRNLLDNALRYSPDGAQVRVEVARADGRLRLAIEDNGPGLGAEDLARLGERFFRVLGTQRSGSGLGWSIVRRIAAAHGATVHADRSPALGGLRATIDWPAAT